MEGGRAPYSPYNDLTVDTGRNAFTKLSSEEKYFMVPKSSFNDENYKHQRRYAVRFIENLSKKARISDALIPYTAMTYFDRCISRGREFSTVVTPDSTNRDLFLTCCLILAWKIRTMTFSLISFLRATNLDYTVEIVFAMERRICVHLEWRLLSLTPFYFIEYYIPILHLPSHPPFLRRPLRQLIVKSQFDIAFQEYSPSVLAASAVLVVTSKMFPQLYTNTLEDRMISSELISPLKDEILKCKKELEPLCKYLSTPAATHIEPPAVKEEGTSSGMKPEEPKADTHMNPVTIGNEAAAKNEGTSSAEVEPEELKVEAGEDAGSVHAGRNLSDPITILTSPAESKRKQDDMAKLRNSLEFNKDNKEEVDDPAGTDFSMPDYQVMADQKIQKAAAPGGTSSVPVDEVERIASKAKGITITSLLTTGTLNKDDEWESPDIAQIDKARKTDNLPAGVKEKHVMPPGNVSASVFGEIQASEQAARPAITESQRAEMDNEKEKKLNMNKPAEIKVGFEMKPTETPETETDNEEGKVLDKQAAGQMSQRPGKETADETKKGSEMPLSQMEVSIPPVDNQEAISEENRAYNRRAGKEPAATAETESILKRHPTLAGNPDDEAMDFELGWIEAQEEADKKDQELAQAAAAAAAGGAGYGIYLVQILAHCCTSFVNPCSIL